MIIPFLKLQIGKAPEQKRGLAFGRFFGSDPQRDFTGIRLSVEQLYEVYRVQGDVFACVRELREGIGRNGYKFIGLDDEAIDIPEVDEILNALKPWKQLKSETVRDKYVAGNAFWHKVQNTQGNKIVGIQRLDPRTMSIVATVHGDIVRYIQRVQDRVVVFDPSEVIHFKYDCDPTNEIMGFSPLESIIWDAKTDIAAAVSNHAFFENYAMPTALYLLEPGMSDEQQKNAIDTIANQFKGADKHHKSGVLAGVKDIKTMTMSAKDMEFLAGRRFVTEKVCSAFGVPKFKLGLGEDANYANGREFNRSFYDDTIEPADDDFAYAITRGLIEPLGYKARMEFNAPDMDTDADMESRALLEHQQGLLTLRQYKTKTKQEVDETDELNPMVDKHIIIGQAQLLEDVGINLDEPYTGDTYGDTV